MRKIFTISLLILLLIVASMLISCKATMYKLTISVSPENSGTIAVTVDGETVESNEDGDYLIAEGSTATLTATPSGVYDEVAWDGATVDGSDSFVATVVMDADKSVTATFSETMYTLAVTVNPYGSGTVDVTVDGNAVTGDGSGNYEIAEGNTATLTATLSGDYVEAEWSGATVDGTDPLIATVVMDADKNVTANFFKLFDVTVTYTEVDGGVDVEVDDTVLTPTVNGNDHVYTDIRENSLVKLTATPEGTNNEVSWGGDLNGSQIIKTFTIASDKNITATFAEVTFNTFYRLEEINGSIYIAAAKENAGMYEKIAIFKDGEILDGIITLSDATEITNISYIAFENDQHDIALADDESTVYWSTTIKDDDTNEFTCGYFSTADGSWTDLTPENNLSMPGIQSFLSPDDYSVYYMDAQNGNAKTLEVYIGGTQITLDDPFVDDGSGGALPVEILADRSGNMETNGTDIYIAGAYEANDDGVTRVAVWNSDGSVDANIDCVSTIGTVDTSQWEEIDGKPLESGFIVNTDGSYILALNKLDEPTTTNFDLGLLEVDSSGTAEIHLIEEDFGGSGDYFIEDIASDGTDFYFGGTAQKDDGTGTMIDGSHYWSGSDLSSLTLTSYPNDTTSDDMLFIGVVGTTVHTLNKDRGYYDGTTFHTTLQQIIIFD